MATSPTALFERLGARLANQQWSWGGVRADGSVVLRVWADETRSVDGRRFVRLVNHAEYARGPHNSGYQERLRHLDAIRSGAAAYVVFCRARNPADRPRSIASFERRELIRLGEVRNIDGDEWGEMLARVQVSHLASSEGGD